MKLYILFESLDIGYIVHICTCKKCAERGSAEAEVHYLNSDCILSIPIAELRTRNEIIAINNDLDWLESIKLAILSSNTHLCTLLEKELLNKNS